MERNRGAADVLMDPHGVQEIHARGKKIGLGGIDKIYTSDRQRAMDTARILAAHTGATLHTDPALNPWPMGGLEGKSTTATQPAIDRLQTTKASQIPAGLSPYPSLPAESYNQYKDRYLPALDRIMASHEKDPYQRDMLVTHGSDLRTTHAWAAAGFPKDYSIDHRAVLTEAPSTGKGELLHQHPSEGWKISSYDPGDQSPEPYGIFLQRHGETEWN